MRKFFHTQHTKFHILYSGFTLIELLIVIAIIGVMATFITFTFRSSPGRARDTQRKSDLDQYRTSLETYANRSNGSYPVSGVVAADTLCGIMGLTITCPVDPKNGTGSFGYKYTSDGIKYILYDVLETPASTTYFAMCSAGTTLTLVQSSAPGLGACP